MALTNLKLLEALHQADVTAFQKVSDWPSHTSWRASAKLVSRTADGWLYPFIPLVLCVDSPAVGLHVFSLLAIGYATERALYYALKNGIKRSRPPKVIPGFSSTIQAFDEFSFPSGHTSAAFLAATTLVLAIPSPLVTCIYLWSIAVGFSRIVLGVHFPLDTIAGAVLGSTIAFAIFSLFTA